MRVTFIGHAAILIEANGVSILSDPWWVGPCFGHQWWIYPPPYLEALHDREVDYIYVSHGHHDHLHLATLRTFSKRTRVLVSSAGDLAPVIKHLGFEVIQVPAHTHVDLGNSVRVRILPTHADDTLMTVWDGAEVCVNLNDALHSAPRLVQHRFIALLHRVFPKLDYVFCGHGTASHFPNCYFIPGKDNVRTAAKRQRYFNEAWARIIRDLHPEFGFPFAADVAVFDNALVWANEVVHNTERPTTIYAKTYGVTKTAVLDIAPGFIVESGKVIRNALRTPLPRSLATVEGPRIERANRVVAADREAITRLADLLASNVRMCEPYLAGFAGDYRCLVRFEKAPAFIEVHKVGASISVSVVAADLADRSRYDVVLTTRPSYLNQSLRSQYGHEILFVGSGALFEFAEAATIDRNVHGELMVMVKHHGSCPVVRATVSGSILRRLKMLIKRLLKRADEDLYDLRTWTVFRD